LQVIELHDFSICLYGHFLNRLEDNSVLERRFLLFIFSR